MTQHDKLLHYMRGWYKGAGLGALDDKMFEYPDYKKGYDEGVQARKQAYKHASFHYGAELIVIKTG